jgi:CheY-like chemotaxis protein
MDESTVTKRKTIIIVEDDFILAKVTQLQLARLGYDVIAIYSSGEQTLQGLESLNPDLILMDIQLSGKLDGIQTVEAIRQNRQIPVIYMTGNSDESTKQRALSTDCNAYLVKPVEKLQLEAAVTATFEAARS